MLVAAAICPAAAPHSWIAQWVRAALESGADLLLCPGFYGDIYGEDFLGDMRRLSKQHKDLLLCPGTYREVTAEGAYHSASLFYRGEIVLTQRQIYLSASERAEGLLRGHEIQTVTFHKTHIGVLMPTDAWYPQVARAQALAGVQLLLHPAAFPDALPTACEQTAWSAAQQNPLYVLVSALDAEHGGVRYAGETILFSPLALCGGRKRDGVLARGSDLSTVLAMPLEAQRLAQATAASNPLKRLNAAVYRDSLYVGGEVL